MGVGDEGTPIGINRNMLKDMKKNFVNLPVSYPEYKNRGLFFKKPRSSYFNNIVTPLFQPPLPDETGWKWRLQCPYLLRSPHE